MRKPICFYYDFVSPYSYFAFSQRDQIRERTGRELQLLPVTVGKIMEMVGNVPTSITCKTKRAYQGQDVMRWVEKLQIPFAIHPQFGTFSTEPLVQAALRAGEDVEAFSEAAFQAVWAEQAPVTDNSAMHAYFAGKEERFAAYWAENDLMKDALEKNNNMAVDDGVFGVPYFHTDSGDFFGNDRLDFLYEAIAS